MLESLTESLLSAFRNGVAILLIGTIFTVTITRLYGTDENGVRIRDLYRNKRLVIALAISLPLASAVLFGFTQPVLVRSFQDPRLLVMGVGILLPLLLIRTNDEAKNWNVLDGNRDTLAIIGISLILIFSPWFGPPGSVEILTPRHYSWCINRAHRASIARRRLRSRWCFVIGIAGGLVCKCHTSIHATEPETTQENHNGQIIGEERTVWCKKHQRGCQHTDESVPEFRVRTRPSGSILGIRKKTVPCD
jgi:hypothetical protein